MFEATTPSTSWITRYSSLRRTGVPEAQRVERQRVEHGGPDGGDDRRLHVTGVDVDRGVEQDRQRREVGEQNSVVGLAGRGEGGADLPEVVRGEHPAGLTGHGHVDRAIEAVPHP